MPFVHEYAPISALLKAGSIAGAGAGIAKQKADALARQQQDQQLAAQLAQQHLQNVMANEQRVRETQAGEQANQIQTALQFSKLQQDQNQFDAIQQSRQAEIAAQQMLAQQREREDVRQFDERQALGRDRLDLSASVQENKVEGEQARDQEVLSAIDQMFPPGSEQNKRMRLAYTANNRLPAPASGNAARDLNAISIRMKQITDEVLGGPLAGFEDEYDQLNQAAQQIAQELGPQATAAAPAPVAAPPVTATNPQTGQKIFFDPATNQWLPVR